MKITKEIVEHVAELARIELDDETTEKMRDELGAIVDYVGILNRVDTKNIEPLSHVFTMSNVMRRDEIVPSYDRGEILSNAPEHTDETVIVPKTIE